MPQNSIIVRPVAFSITPLHFFFGSYFFTLVPPTISSVTLSSENTSEFSRVSATARVTEPACETNHANYHRVKGFYVRTNINRDTQICVYLGVEPGPISVIASLHARFTEMQLISQPPSSHSVSNSDTLCAGEISGARWTFIPAEFVS